MRATQREGATGQFDVIVDGVVVASRGGNFLTRRLGMGYPDFDVVLQDLERANEEGA